MTAAPDPYLLRALLESWTLGPEHGVNRITTRFAYDIRRNMPIEQDRHDFEENMRKAREAQAREDERRAKGDG